MEADQRRAAASEPEQHWGATIEVVLRASAMIREAPPLIGVGFGADKSELFWSRLFWRLAFWTHRVTRLVSKDCGGLLLDQQSRWYCRGAMCDQQSSYRHLACCSCRLRRVGKDARLPARLDSHELE